MGCALGPTDPNVTPYSYLKLDPGGVEVMRGIYGVHTRAYIVVWLIRALGYPPQGVTEIFCYLISLAESHVVWYRRQVDDCQACAFDFGSSDCWQRFLCEIGTGDMKTGSCCVVVVMGGVDFVGREGILRKNVFGHLRSWLSIQSCI